MAIVANTFLTYDAKGIREDLSDVIYDISPEETPLLQMAKREKAKNTLFEWQVDELAAVNTGNKVIEGDEVAFDAVTPTTRLGNYCQISRKSVIVSGTHEAVDKAGRDSEMAYQLARRSAELKRDMEAICLANQGAAAGNSTTARATGSLLAFLKTNTSKGTGGVDPSYTSVPTGTRTDGTQRAFTETLLKAVILAVYQQGGQPKVLMVPPAQKQTASGFAGIAQLRFNAQGNKPATIIGAADIYVSDFGNVEIVPNRFMRSRDALVIDPRYVGVAYLRPFKTEPLAKTGDAEKRLLVVEWGLKVHNEKAHGIIADLS
jgi:hypothetical protein